MAKKKRSKNSVKVDLSNVELRKVVPKGYYSVAVEEAEIKDSQSGSQYIAITFLVTDGDFEGSKLFHNVSLQPHALFNLKALLLALEMDIPKKAFNLDIDDLIGEECVVQVEEEIYEGKKKSRVVDVIGSDEYDEEEDDDEDDEEDEDEVEEDEEEEDYEDWTLKELKAEARSRGLKFSKKDKKDDIIELLEEDDEE